MNIDLQTKNIVKTKLEQRGNEYKIKAPVTGSVVLNNAVVASFGDGSLRFFGLNQEPFEVKAHKGVILTMSSNGQFVYTGGDDGKFLKISSDGQVNEIYNFGSQWVDCVASTENYFACSSGKKAYLWVNDDSKPLIMDNSSTVGGLSFDLEGNKLAVSSYGGVTVWQRGDRRWKSSRFVWKGSHGKVG